MEPSKIAIVVIGQEVLNGMVEDTNSRYAAQKIYEKGADLVRIVTVPDDTDAIAEVVKCLSPKVDFVITSGGIGATHDDRTVDGVAKALDQKVIRHTYLETIVSRNYMGADLSASQARLAEIPEGGELIAREGDELPQIFAKNIYMLPGIPELFRQRFDLLLPLFHGSPWTHKVLKIKSIETKIAATLIRAEHAFPNVRVGSHPHLLEGKERKLGEVCAIDISVESRNAEEAEKAFTFVKENLPKDTEFVS
ncbi:MAG: hypothetical protein K6G50_00915 [bacterium]|nr:hypothetical protein [bacterium]